MMYTLNLELIRKKRLSNRHVKPLSILEKVIFYAVHFFHNRSDILEQEGIIFSKYKPLVNVDRSSSSFYFLVE